MLNFVLGRNLSGKTEYVRNLVAEGVRSGGDRYVIIVPEQFSYETEKAMLNKVGADGMQRLDVLSLSRLAEIILEQCGENSLKPPADDGVRVLSMSSALDALEGRLEVFKKYSSRPALMGELISFASEIKQCSVSTDELKAFADSMKQSSLKNKLSELSLIISLYNLIIDNSYYDSSDALTLLCSALDGYCWFENRTVVIDAFTRFTKQELYVIEKIIKQSENVYFTFCTDGVKTDGFSVFANVEKQIEALKNLARKNNVGIAKPVILKPCENKREKYLSILEENFFTDGRGSFDDNPESIKICSAPTQTDECEFVALTVKRLLREENARCRDIIVYERKKDTYDRKLTAAFRKFGVPFFEDKRQPVSNQPLVIFINTLLETAVEGISTDVLMRHLKSGLSSLSETEIAELENYALMWKISASGWQNDFTENPRGFGTPFNDFDTATLQRLNEYRKKAVAPVLAFRRDFSEAQGEKKTEILYSFLVKSNVRQRLKDLAMSLLADGKDALYEEQDTVWTLVTDMLDKLYRSTLGANISVKRYRELFNTLLFVSDIGTVPQGLDSVTIGAADRTRTGEKKYVFIVGANAEVFPLMPSTKGLLNDRERILLRENGIELANTAEYKLIEEKFFAYHALSTATERLFVTYSASDSSGESLIPSEIVTEITEIFPNIDCKAFENIASLQKIESKQSAFEMLAKNYGDNSIFSVAAEEFFNSDSEYKGRLSALKKAVEKTPQTIKSAETATELFGKNMYLSASKAETYYKCPFQYFCRYGIKAEPRKEAQIDAALSGSIIHFVFEKMFSGFSKKKLQEMSDDELAIEIDKILKIYLNENMGGGENKSKRFIKHYETISLQTFSILKRMIEEFKTSEFTPVDFELSIGNDGEIMPYELTLPNGSSLKISGSVDRVDTMEKNGKKYLRVVDYKSNGKTFNLYDVIEGLSAQMLIYLFAIERNGERKYGDIIPSGVLYMSAKPEAADLGRNATQEEIDKKRLKSNRMNGLVLNDMTVIEGMEKDIGGVFIPVSMNSDGVLKGSLITSEEFNKLHKKVDEVLKSMVVNLQSGLIPVLPAGEDACKWCDYRSVCGYETGDKLREIPKLKSEEVLKILDGEGEEIG